MTDLAALRAALARPGKASLPWVDARGNPDRPLTLHTYRPHAWSPGRPVVVVQHGMLRNGADYRDFWANAADRFAVLVLAPELAAEHWPRHPAYNDGLVWDDTGRARPRERWAYATPGRLVRRLRDEGTLGEGPVHLFGHSAGGQFVHRLVATLGAAPFAATIAANAGWYTLPALDRPCPEGLGEIGLDDAAVGRWLAWPLVVLAGDADTETEGDSLPGHDAARRQGPHRFARAKAFVAAGRDAADRRGVACGWRLVEVPGVGHDGAAMSVAAATWWFAGRLPTAAEAGLVVRPEGARRL
jgi:poly(3-hydroxybutyrate) depolymerase